MLTLVVGVVAAVVLGAADVSARTGSGVAACPTGSCLSGRVVDVRGRPLAQVIVTADPSTRRPQKDVSAREARTDADGRFLVEGLRPGAEYEVWFGGGHRQCNNPTRNLLAIDSGLVETLDQPVVLRFPSFTVLPSGAIADPKSGLEWAPDPGRAMTWREAATHVRETTFAGGGWRLPTRAELRALYAASVESGCGLLHLVAAPDTGRDESFGMQCCYAWSGDLEGSDAAWVFYFQYGEDKVYAIDHQSYGYSRVLAVRAMRK